MKTPIRFPQKTIEKYYVKCDFNDTCDSCSNPQHGSYAVGYSNDENGCEVDSYICGKCSSAIIPSLIEEENKINQFLKSSEPTMEMFKKLTHNPQTNEKPNNRTSNNSN